MIWVRPSKPLIFYRGLWPEVLHNGYRLYSVPIRVPTLQEYATVMHLNTMLQFHGTYDCIANLCYTLLQPEHCTSLWKAL